MFITHLVFTVHLSDYVFIHFCYTCVFSPVGIILPSTIMSHIMSDESILASLDEIIANEESDDEFISDLFGNYYYYYLVIVRIIYNIYPIKLCILLFECYTYLLFYFVYDCE